MHARQPQPFPLTALAAIGMAALIIATGAQAHGGEHAAPRTYDAKQVTATEFGQEGNPAKVTRTIKIDMSDAMRFTPAALQIKRGETIRFIVSNSGQVLHEMVLGTPQALKTHADLMRRFPGMEHADANMTHVKPGQAGEVVWQFTKAGDFQFACLIPGHFEAGMVGALVVK